MSLLTFGQFQRAIRICPGRRQGAAALYPARGPLAVALPYGSSLLSRGAAPPAAVPVKKSRVLRCFLLFPFFPRASERRVLPIVGVCNASSHLHIFSSSHLLILTSSPIHIFSSSHLLIFTSSHLHIFSSSHLLIFTSSHLHIFSSSHLLIFSSSHLHVFSSSHLLIFTSSHLHIFSSSHLLIFTSSHLHIFSSSHLLISTSHLHIFFLYFSLEGAGQCQRDGTKRNPFARNEVRSPKTEVKLRFQLVRRNPFARNEVRSSKTAVKLRVQVVPRNPFRTK